jgi:glutathione S-transferase
MEAAPMQPTLYWISGSPPAWRVMLAMVLKDIAFTSRRLDHAKGENRTAEYLALNPKGQVPTVTFGETVVRESIAILAWLEHEAETPQWKKRQEAARQLSLF